MIPYIFIYIIREIKVKREIELYVNISPSLIIGGVLVVISYYLIRSIAIISELSSFALSASMSLVSIGLFIMISRKKAIMQMLGILIMENGLFLGAISLTNGMPLLVELGIFFDVLIGVLIMGILIFRINKTFESIDTDYAKNSNRLIAMIEYLLLAPIITGILCFFTRTKKQVETVSLGFDRYPYSWFVLVRGCLHNGVIVTWQNALFADAFSAYIVLIVSIMGFVSSIYSIGYMGYELDHNVIDLKRLKLYYVLFHIFMFTMLLVGVTNNLGLWIAIEMTTLVSALLIIFYSNKSSVEAAWKYVIISTVGITFALFGTILTYYAAVKILGETGDALNWTSLIAVAGQFDPDYNETCIHFYSYRIWHKSRSCSHAYMAS